MNLNNSNTKFYIILILIILILVGIYVNFIKKKREYFNDKDKYVCDFNRGCISPPPDTKSENILTYDECDKTCKFDFIDGACTKTTDSVNSYESGFKCNNRFVCSDVEGRCVFGPVSASEESFEKLEDCNDNCKFSKNDEGDGCKLDPDGTFLYKYDCEYRFKCINGICKKVPGDESEGVFSSLGSCETECKNEIFFSDKRMYLNFDKNFNDLNEFNKGNIKNKVKGLVIGSGTLIGVNHIIGIILVNNEAEVVFKNNLELKVLEKVELRLLEKSSSFVEDNIQYNLQSIKLLKLGSLKTIASPSTTIDSGNDYLVLEIKNFRNKYSLNTIDFSLANINEEISQMQKIDILRENSQSKKIDITLPESIIIKSRKVSSNFDFETDLSQRYIKIQKINSNLKKLMEVQKYLDIETINEIYINSIQDSCKLLTIGDRNDTIFPYNNEFFLILYETVENKLKYKQLKVDLERLKIIKCEEEKEKLRQGGNLSDIEFYKTFISNLQNTNILDKNRELDYQRLLFDNYNSNLRLELVINEYKNKKLNDVLIYTEELSPSKNELVCDFKPYGQTQFECIQKCTNNNINNCSESQCNSLCKNCGTLECEWNITDFNKNNSLKPEPVKIKGFSGNKAIKVTWIKPLSKFSVEKYYITVSNSIENILNIYKFESSSDINEYIINNLRNGILYDVMIVAKNRFGVSEISNTESVIPSEVNTFSEISEIRSSDYEDSIESYYKNNNEDIIFDNTNLNSNNISLFEKEIIKNDLKEILFGKLSPKPYNNYTINIY